MMVMVVLILLDLAVVILLLPANARRVSIGDVYPVAIDQKLSLKKSYECCESVVWVRLSCFLVFRFLSRTLHSSTMKDASWTRPISI